MNKDLWCDLVDVAYNTDKLEIWYVLCVLYLGNDSDKSSITFIGHITNLLEVCYYYHDILIAKQHV